MGLLDGEASVNQSWPRQQLGKFTLARFSKG